jgi:ketosteroid isomerase-like protein
MSAENLRIIRAQYEAWNRGDMDAVAADYALDATLNLPPEWPDATGPIVGRSAIMEHFAQLREVWGDTDSAVAHDFDARGDHVLVKTTWRGQGLGPEVAMDYTNVYTLRDGTITRLDVFRDHAEALEAVGLAE